MEARNEVGIFDATNSTKRRRLMLMKMAEGKCKVIFLETICNDERIIERNIRLKIQQSPDYAEEPDFEAGLQDFKERLVNYQKVIYFCLIPYVRVWSCILGFILDNMWVYEHFCRYMNR
ncbi:6-phosphofructo-2-kinase/fructose-2,6-bisphosphatase isoform X2 [Carex littledalei]|uniref:6-phosphofructo-2-kinase/fructose-2, 6-bisphosphatase isoform X2 n=1 Tax=Carex littledalei TaxID=544730 RepID=A0A833VC91_9POAL|nr:6-phosphofructo-2-kinase/fructose-2,6-bisphosphatase isoform X2 [Carex littledalei]